jgi:hypothetical protein
MVDECQVRMLSCIRQDDFPRVVRRTVIDADYLELVLGDILRIDAVQTTGYVAADVVTGKDERKLNHL